MTTVVNIKFEKCDVYIGREGHGLSGFFGNPHVVYNPLKSWTICPICKIKHTREEAIAAFKKDFNLRIRNDLEFRQRVLELRDKKLGCFCSPSNCHGDVYADWLNSHTEFGS